MFILETLRFAQGGKLQIVFARVMMKCNESIMRMTGLRECFFELAQMLEDLLPSSN